MAKKNKNNNKNRDILASESFILGLSEANPDIPISVIRDHVYKDISTSDFLLRGKAAANPEVAYEIVNRPLISKKLRNAEVDKYPKIPYIKDKEIKLTKGKYNTGKISTNLLDSIYDSSIRAGVPFEEALGLAGVESTLGIGRGFKEGESISPTDLMSNWQLVQTIINTNSMINEHNKLKNKYSLRIPFIQDEIELYRKFVDNDYKEAASTRPIKENPIDNALKYYKLELYNINSSDHTRLVKENGRLLLAEPAILKWLSTKQSRAYGGRVNKFNIGGPVKALKTNPSIPTNKLTNPLGNSPITNTLSGGLKFGALINNFMGNLGSGITDFFSSGLGINMISNAAFGLLNPNGNSTGVGNVMQDIGGLASNIPGAGGIIGAAVGAVGGLVNTAFGSNINEENVALFRNLNKQLANYTSNASTNEELLADFSGLTHLADVNRKDVGSDGWFSNKAKNLTKDINAERLLANLKAIASLGNTALTVDTTNDLLKGYNYSAYGGPVNMKYTGTMSPFGNQFKDGGIYIKPENRGKFTALKERTGKSATWFKQHGTPAQKKMATFALNSRKWRHDNGGPLEELTPKERLNIALGRTPSGRPLEQGLINVHPEMMFIPSGNLSTVGNITGNLGLSFGKKAAVKSLRGLEYILRNTDKLKKKVDNTVYDVIDDITESAIEGVPELSNVLNKASKATKRTYEIFKNSKVTPALFQDMNSNVDDNLNIYEEPLREGHEDYAFGGELTHGGVFSNNVLQINEGGTHLENPYDGILLGVDEQGIPNLVEEGELIWNDYVFSNRLKVPKAVRLKYKLRGNKELSFADAAKNILKESEERPNDVISLNGLDAGLSRLAMEQELIRMKKLLRLNRFDRGGHMKMEDLSIFNEKSPVITTPPPPIYEPIPDEDEIILNTGKSKEFKESPLRYAPIVGHTAGVINDIFSKPDYLAADEIRGIELNPSLVGFTPIGNRLRFTPYDINYLINKLNASSGAARRNIMNTSGGNRAAAIAGLMGVDYNYTNALGDAYRQALEYNDARREAVETFNRATDLYNAEMGLKAAMTNAESRNAMAKARYERDKAAALLGQLARDAYNTRRSNNLNILLEDLGNLGKERNARKWADVLADKGVLKMNSKGEHLSKNGGKLNRKKKGGFTYA